MDTATFNSFLKSGDLEVFKNMFTYTYNQFIGIMSRRWRYILMKYIWFKPAITGIWQMPVYPIFRITKQYLYWQKFLHAILCDCPYSSPVHLTKVLHLCISFSCWMNASGFIFFFKSYQGPPGMLKKGVCTSGDRLTQNVYGVADKGVREYRNVWCRYILWGLFLTGLQTWNYFS
jgi:hypothetical protein